MAQGREFASHGSSVDRIGEQLLDEIAHVFTLGIEQCALVLFQERGELAYVRGVGPDCEWCQALFDFQIIEEAGDYAGIGFGRHILSMRVIGL